MCYEGNINCLDVIKDNENIILAHVNNSENNSRLNLSVVPESSLFSNKFFMKNKWQIKLDNKNGLCHKVCLKKLDDDFLCLICFKNSLQLNKVHDKGVMTFSIDDVCENSSVLTDVVLHSTLPGIYGFARSDGVVKLYNIEVKKHFWTKHFKDERFKENGYYFGCSFGYNSLDIYAYNRTKVWLQDTRNYRSSNVIFDIEKLKNYSCSSDRIYSFKSVENLPFVYAVCSNSTHLIDERFCKVPVLSWQHLLNGNPNLVTSVRCDDNLEVLAFANSSIRKVCMITNKWNTQDFTDISCNSISMPKHFDFLNNTLHEAHKNNHWWNPNIKKRLESQLTGIYIDKFATIKDNYFMLMLNSHGDIFNQNFVLNSSSVKNDLTFSLNDQLKLLKNWEKRVEVTDTNSFANYKFCKVEINKPVSSSKISTQERFLNIYEKVEYAKKLKKDYSWNTVLLKEYKYLPGNHKKQPLSSDDKKNYTCLPKEIEEIEINSLLENNNSIDAKIINQWSSIDIKKTLDKNLHLYESSPLDTSNSNLSLRKLMKPQKNINNHETSPNDSLNSSSSLSKITKPKVDNDKTIEDEFYEDLITPTQDVTLNDNSVLMKSFSTPTSSLKPSIANSPRPSKNKKKKARIDGF